MVSCSKERPAEARSRPPEGEPDAARTLAAKLQDTVATKATLQAMGEDTSALDADITAIEERLRRFMKHSARIAQRL